MATGDGPLGLPSDAHGLRGVGEGSGHSLVDTSDFLRRSGEGTGQHEWAWAKEVGVQPGLSSCWGN